jgi:hypothetical protein
MPRHQINVFISSACGSDRKRQKYNIVRAGLKALIESTQLAKVYLFEDEGASSISAEQHFISALEECDVCIFLVDNKDGIPDGVQAEIDTVNKRGIKALYYFCDQFRKKKTPLEERLRGAKHAKTKVVHSFEEFLENGATDLIEELIIVYKYYCQGRLLLREESNTHTGDLAITSDATFSDTLAQKDMLTKIDHCKNYFSKLVLNDKTEIITSSCEMDALFASFLPVMFEGVALVDTLDLTLLLDELKKHQSPEHFLVTERRYQAIEAYYSDNLEEAIAHLQEALRISKSEHLPEWLAKDILIDLRNLEIKQGESNNRYSHGGQYQDELSDSDSILFYPLADRFNAVYYRELTDDTIKHRLRSPYVISFGHNITTYTNSLASVYVLALYYGSITHLRMLYERITTLAFLCAERYSDWNLKLLLLKTSIITCGTRKIDDIIKHFGDVLGKMNSADAKEIYSFANNNPIAHERFSAKLKAFGITGYFLDDTEFLKAWNELYALTIEWIEGDSALLLGSLIFTTLEKVYLRINQEHLAEIICKCFEHGMRRFYDDLFQVIANCIVLEELSNTSSRRLINAIIQIISDENERNNINNLHIALYSLRKQNRNLTDELDKAIAENLPIFYKEDYCLETTDNTSTDMPRFIAKYIGTIEDRNETQGRDGGFIEFADRPHIIIKSIIQQHVVDIDDELIDAAFRASCETLLRKEQLINTKIDALNLIVFLLKKTPSILERNKETVTQILTNKEIVETGSESLTNLNNAILQFCALLLYDCLGKDVSHRMIEILADIGADTLSQIEISHAFTSYLKASQERIKPELESIILQNSLKWCYSDNLSVRLNAVNILFELLRNPQNHSIVLKQLVRLFDTDNLYIKNRILRKLHALNEIDVESYEYILQKARVDTNYVVRSTVLEAQFCCD